MRALKSYLDRETLEKLTEDILDYRYIEFVYNKLRYYISVYDDDDVSIQVIDDHNELKNKEWPQRATMIQNEIHYSGLKELFDNYHMQDGTPILDIVRDSRVEWTS